MIYQGIKFKTKIINKEIPKHPGLEELKYWCREFHKFHLAPPYSGGSYGNLSFRVKKGEDSFIITGSKIGLKEKLSDDCFVKVLSSNLKAETIFISGIKEPSSESKLHLAIYRQRKDINAIFHGHCKKILSNADRLKIPQTQKEELYGTMELVQRVLEILDDKSFLIMKNHGFISLGKTMEKAGKLALEIHKKCL
ncbi:class II aldolase/adducin family protein [bacterium]|nr:class II aldolase/adducin family protein [bacterium]